MNKEVIYIDTEDDITAIIGKIKDSKEKIVALVPPKRIGVLQSAVNLRLLARMAENSDKRLVLVTNNKALINLSSVAQIPIAKNLQSKPEMIELDDAEIDDSEDVIEGNQLPIGELMKTSDDDKESVDDAIKTIDVEKDALKIEPKPGDKNSIKVPNFSSFRKKLFLGFFLLLCLVGFLVWAMIYAPAAKVIITAKTSPESAFRTVKLGGVAATDIAKGTIQTISKQIKKDVSVSFTATGEENVGNKATGIITVENCDSNIAFDIDAGTVFTSGSGQTFANASLITVPGFTGSASACRSTGLGAGSVDVPVVALKPGTTSNLAPTNYSIAGISGDIYAHGLEMTGGTDKISTVVTAADVQKASQALADLSSDSVKQQLIKQFTNGESVIGESFNVVHEAPIPSPAIGAEAATGKATLTSLTTFSIIGIAKTEIELYLKDELAKKVTDKSQRVYSYGIDKVVISEYLSTDQGATVKISTDAGQVGPNIDQAVVKQQVKGKKFGDAQLLLANIPGVSNVDIKFSYFWVTTLPSDIEKIEVQFIIENA